MPNSEIQPELFPLPAAASRLSISDASMRALVRLGKIPSVRIGARQMIRRETLADLVARGMSF